MRDEYGLIWNSPAVAVKEGTGQVSALDELKLEVGFVAKNFDEGVLAALIKKLENANFAKTRVKNSSDQNRHF